MWSDPPERGEVCAKPPKNFKNLAQFARFPKIPMKSICEVIG